MTPKASLAKLKSIYQFICLQSSPFNRTQGREFLNESSFQFNVGSNDSITLEYR